MVPSDRWAWLAGLFEGEGSIAFTGRNSVFLDVGSTDEDIVRRCAEITGVGQVWCEDRPNPKWKRLWRWRAARAHDVELVLAQIAPYFGERRGARATAAIERLARCRRQGYCSRGHPMAGDNLYVSPNGYRMCRTCRRRRDAERRRPKS
jgi:hypothetical protein